MERRTHWVWDGREKEAHTLVGREREMEGAHTGCGHTEGAGEQREIPHTKGVGGLERQRDTHIEGAERLRERSHSGQGCVCGEERG